MAERACVKRLQKEYRALCKVGENAYGSIPSYSSKPYGLPSTLKIVILAHAVGKVMGKGGANIGNIRKSLYFYMEQQMSKQGPLIQPVELLDSNGWIHECNSGFHNCKFLEWVDEVANG